MAATQQVTIEVVPDMTKIIESFAAMSDALRKLATLFSEAADTMNSFVETQIEENEQATH